MKLIAKEWRLAFYDHRKNFPLTGWKWPIDLKRAGGPWGQSKVWVVREGTKGRSEMRSVKKRWKGTPSRLRDNSRTRFNKTAYVQHHQKRGWFLGKGKLRINKLKLGANLSIDHSRKPCTWLNVWLWSGYKSLIFYLQVVGCSSLLNLSKSQVLNYLSFKL